MNGALDYQSSVWGDHFSGTLNEEVMLALERLAMEIGIRWYRVRRVG
jgi:hypothetical protein